MPSFSVFFVCIFIVAMGDPTCFLLTFSAKEVQGRTRITPSDLVKHQRLYNQPANNKPSVDRRRRRVESLMAENRCVLQVRGVQVKIRMLFERQGDRPACDPLGSAFSDEKLLKKHSPPPQKKTNAKKSLDFLNFFQRILR